jgi:hypothetical protein
MFMRFSQSIGEIPEALLEADTYSTDYQAYVFHYSADEGLFKRERLRLVYHNEFTGAAVGVRPEVFGGERAVP